MEFRKPCGSAIMYSSGKVVIVECKSVTDGTTLAKKLSRILARIGIQNRVSNFKYYD